MRWLVSVDESDILQCCAILWVVGVLISVESMIDKFSYRVMLCPFLPWPCFLLNMVVGGLTVTDISIAGHLLLRANRMVKNMGCMGKRIVGMREKDDRQIGKMDGIDGLAEAIDQVGSGVS